MRGGADLGEVAELGIHEGEGAMTVIKGGR